MIDQSELKPDRYYWAKVEGQEGDGRIEIVQISTVFGAEREYWTIARLGSDLHAMLEDFRFLGEVEPRPFCDT